MKTRLLWGGLGLWLLAIAAVAQVVAWRGTIPSGPARTLTAEAPAEGITMLDLSAADGTVTISAAPDDHISLSVEVATPESTGRWFDRAPGDSARAELVTERRGNVFVARVTSAGNAPLVERWNIRVPQRFRVGIAAHDSLVDVRDVTGGVLVTAKAGLNSRPGRISVDVPQGLLDLKLGVGTIDARTTSVSRGPVDVRSDVGDARLTVAGRAVKAARAPGPGHRLRLDDEGPDPMRVRVGVGDASLTIK